MFDFFFFTYTATPGIYPLSLRVALPIFSPVFSLSLAPSLPLRLTLALSRSLSPIPPPALFAGAGALLGGALPLRNCWIWPERGSDCGVRTESNLDKPCLAWFSLA